MPNICFYNKLYAILFFTIDQILIFWKALFILSDWKRIPVSSLNISLIFFCISSIDPGKMQHNLSLFLLLEENSHILKGAVEFSNVIFYAHPVDIDLVY